MSLAREVNLELEREEDCDMEPATEYVLKTIVEEEYFCKDYAATTTTSGYSKVGVKNKQGSLDCLQQNGVQDTGARGHFVTENTGAEKDSATVTETEDVGMCDVSKVSAQGDTVIKDTDRMFVRAMESAVHMVRPGSPSTFKPPTHCQDYGLGVASHDWSFCNITPRSREACRSTDYTRQSTDCTSLSTDCYELPVKNVLPDVAVLPEDKTVFLAGWGEDIVGSVRRRPGSTGDAAVTRQEVAGQPRWSQHTCGPD